MGASVWVGLFLFGLLVVVLVPLAYSGVRRNW
jgi:hypothetical protein